MTSARKPYQNISWAQDGACSTGKRGYSTRADAKRVRAHQAPKGTDGLNVYRCDECDLFHLGHLPKPVRTGEISRRDINRKLTA